MEQQYRKKYKGIICIIISAFCFAWMNLFVRLSGDLPAFQKSFFRNLVAFFFALVMVLQVKDTMKVEKKEWKYLFLRAAFGSLGIVCNYYAIDHMLVADASMLNKLSPFFVILFSYFILKEKIKPFQLACVIGAFIGMLFIIKPGIGTMSIVPALVGTVGGMCAGLAYTYVRKLGNDGVPGAFIVLFFSAFSCLSMIPMMVVDFQPMAAGQVLMLLGAGLAAAGGQFSITAAYTYAPGREISIYDYSQIIFITLLSFFILGEVPDSYSFIGYGLIITASLVMFLYSRRTHRQEILQEKTRREKTCQEKTRQEKARQEGAHNAG